MKHRGGQTIAAFVAVVAALIIGLSGTAIAFVLGGGTNSGVGSTGSATGNGFTVSSPGLQGGPLSLDPPNVDTIWSSISNFTGLPATLHSIEVQITGVTPNPNTQNASWPPCTADQFVLSAPSSSPWLGLTPGPGGVSTGPAATWSENLPLTVPNGDFVTGVQTLSPSVVNAVPAGLTLEWVDQGPSTIQNNCLGATVNVTVSTNGPGSSGGSNPGGGGGGGGGGTSNAANFTVTKAASPSTVYLGSSTPVTYTLTAQNTGTAAGTVYVGDRVPSGTTLVSGSNSCPAGLTQPTTCTTSVSGTVVSWTISNVPAGGSVPVTFQVTVNSGDAPGIISNTGSWSGPGCSSAGGCSTNTTSTNVAAPTPLLITASSTTSSYGSGQPTVTPMYTPSISGSLQTPPTCTSTVTAKTVVGTYAGANTCSGASDPAYIISYAPGTAVVGTAPLTITASTGSFQAGGTPPTISPSYSGFQNGETASSLTTQPTCSTTATSSSSANTYPSTCSGAVDPNYAISYVPGTVTISPVISITTSTTTTTTTVVPASVPVTTSPSIAYTGALLSDEWLIAASAVLLGSLLVVIARWRRRTPRQAAK